MTEKLKPCPFCGNEQTLVCRGGLTLRDWFAGQYMAGNRWSGGTLNEYVRDAWRAADEMLAERERQS